MAMFHLSTKAIGRSSGRSATASSAYRAGVELRDERQGVDHDYTARSGVITNACFILVDSEKVTLNRNDLWNNAEFAEKRKDGRTAREVIVNLPYEIDHNARVKLVDNFAKDISKKYKCGIDYAIHLPDRHGDQRNHHAHIMMTTRNIELDHEGNIQLTSKTNLELSNRKLKELGLPKTQEQITALRGHWANLTNECLQEQGIDKRIDHRSFKERGIDRQPTVKLGWANSALERRGIETDKGNLNRAIRADNTERLKLKEELFILLEAKQGMLEAKTDYKAYKQQSIIDKQKEQELEFDRTQKLEHEHNHSIEIEIGF